MWARWNWISIDEDGTVQVLGRSDATLNRGGVRLGSADLYMVVEGSPRSSTAGSWESELPEGQYYTPLLVVPMKAGAVDDELRERLSSQHPDLTVPASRAGRDRRGARATADIDGESQRYR
jgi:acetoacetyl-CoA synthetase